MDLVERFTDWAKKKGWTIEIAETLMELPEEVKARYKIGRASCRERVFPHV